jgi:hypothetical protein
VSDFVLPGRGTQAMTLADVGALATAAGVILVCIQLCLTARLTEL